MPQIKLSKSALWDLTEAFRDKFKDRVTGLRLEDVIDVLSHMQEANAPAELDEECRKVIDDKKIPKLDKQTPLNKDNKDNVGDSTEEKPHTRAKQNFKPIKCSECGKEFTPKSPNQKRCPECANKIKKEKQNAWQKAHRKPANPASPSVLNQYVENTVDFVNKSARHAEDNKPLDDDIASTVRDIIALGDDES